MSIDFTIWKTK